MRNSEEKIRNDEKKKKKLIIRGGRHKLKLSKKIE